MQVFSMNDCDWWIGPSLKETIVAFVKAEEPGPGEMGGAYQLSEEDLERLTYFDGDGKRSFADQLKLEVQKGGEFPRFFATTEF